MFIVVQLLKVAQQLLPAKAVAPPSLRCVGARRSINIKILIASDTILMLFHCNFTLNAHRPLGQEIKSTGRRLRPVENAYSDTSIYLVQKYFLSKTLVNPQLV